MKHLVFLILLLFWSSSMTATAAGEGRLARVAAVPIPASDAAPAWDGEQFVQADRKGNVFFLRGEDLALFQLGPGDRLVAKGKLRPLATAGDRAVVRQAVMSPAGDVWLLLTSRRELRVFRSGKEEHLPETLWSVSDLAAPSGEPVLAVLPGQRVVGKDAVEGMAPPQEMPPAPPFLLRLEERDWETLVAGEFMSFEEVSGVVGVQGTRDARSVWMAPGPKDSLWVAYRNAYRLRQYSAMGELAHEVVAGGGKVEWVERSEEEWQALEKAAGEEKFPFRRSRLSPVRAEAVVKAMTVDRDGRVWLLVSSKDGLALDRFDPDPNHQLLERVVLEGVDAPQVTLAAGKHGLVLASTEGRGGRWRVGWEDLEAADWTPVDEVLVDGQAPLIPKPVVAETAVANPQSE